MRDSLSNFWRLDDLAVVWVCKCAATTLQDIVAPEIGLKRALPEDLQQCSRALIFIREPVSRLVSCWKDKVLGDLTSLRTHRISRNLVERGLIRRDMSFEAFVDVVLRFPLHNRHWMPISEWSTDARKLPHEFIRFEDLPASWDKHSLSQWPTEHLNSTSGSVDVDDELRSKINTLYADDLMLGQYT